MLKLKKTHTSIIKVIKLILVCVGNDKYLNSVCDIETKPSTFMQLFQIWRHVDNVVFIGSCVSRDKISSAN